MGKADAWNMARALLLPLLSFGFGLGLLNWTLGRADMKLSIAETYGFLFLSAALMVAGTLTYLRQHGFGWLTTSIAAVAVTGALALFLVPKLAKREERAAEDKADRARISEMAESQRRAEEGQRRALDAVDRLEKKFDAFTGRRKRRRAQDPHFDDQACRKRHRY